MCYWRVTLVIVSELSHCQRMLHVRLFPNHLTQVKYVLLESNSSYGKQTRPLTAHAPRPSVSKSPEIGKIFVIGG